MTGEGGVSNPQALVKVEKSSEQGFSPARAAEFAELPDVPFLDTTEAEHEDADPDVFFTQKRGIPEEKWRARPYVWWTPEDPEPATERFADLTPGQRAFVTKLVRQSPGWLIIKHPPPLAPALPPVIPQLRPLKKVKTRGPLVHWHGDGPEPAVLEWTNPETGTTWRGQKMQGARKNWQDHIDRSKGDDDDHDGVNTDEVHAHQNLAKYAHVPSRKMDGAYAHDHDHAFGFYAHDHVDARSPERRQVHVQRYHPDGEPQGQHVHTMRVKDPDAPDTPARLDMHPLAIDLVVRSSVVFFVIEGSIKADAVLADGGAVFSVPSVGQWDCKELRRFVRDYLDGKSVVVVPDADWEEKWQVINQARLCQNALRRYGVKDAYVAASPPQYRGAVTKGVDDFIGAGGHLEDLRVIDYRIPPAVYEFVARQWSWRRDRQWRDTEILVALANFTGSTGELGAPLSTVARALDNIPRARVSRAVRDLETIGALTVDGDLATRRGWFSSQLDWRRRPTIVLAPELRAVKRDPVRLGDLIDIREEGMVAA